MNFTTFFYCTCGFEKAVSEEEDSLIVQCTHCKELVSCEMKIEYEMVCSACDHRTKIEEPFLFEEEHTCEQCALTGKFGLQELHEDALFILEEKTVVEKSCEKCKKNNWFFPEIHPFSCPVCKRNLKQKMSNAWKD